MTNHKYRIALCNVFWSEQDINARFFSSVEEQNTYFDSLTAGKFSSLLNFNMGNNIDTSVTYRDNSGRSVEELVACNYAVIEKYNDETGVIISRRYFFAYPQQDSGTQMRVTLSLDDIQTNYIKYKNTIAPCMIRRANLNRWKDNNDGTVSFNGDIDSKLFEIEAVENVGKRLTKRTALKIQPASNDDNLINEWLKENVIGWEYVYLTQKDDYNFVVPNTSNAKSLSLQGVKTYPFETDSIFGQNTEGNGVEGSLACVCYPIYKNGTFQGTSNVIKLRNGESGFDTNISSVGFNIFKSKNNNNSFVYARKFSILSPFIYQSYPASAVFVDTTTNSLIFRSKQSGDKLPLPTDFNTVGLACGQQNNANHGILQVLQQIPSINLTEEYTVNKQFTFNKSEIVGATKNVKFNPKLLNSQFFELNLVQGAQHFMYDLQKVNNKKFKVAYTEAFTPDITKGYCRIYDLKGVYIKDCQENLTGLVYSNDNSLMVDNDKLSEMLANNKNFFLQNALQMGATIPQAITKPVTTTLENAFNIVDKALTLDNMRSAPTNIKNANGNIYFSSLISPFDIFVEEYDILDAEKEVLNDLMCEFGFVYNQTDKITNFDNIRHYYNYIEADVETIAAPISNIEKERLKQKLKSIRFWNSDTIQYNLENYERGLE